MSTCAEDTSGQVEGASLDLDVTAVEIRDKDASDSPLLPALLDTTKKNFAVSEVSADKADHDALRAKHSQ